MHAHERFETAGKLRHEAEAAKDALTRKSKAEDRQRRAITSSDGRKSVEIERD
jgi:hypothetical protein